MLKPVDKDFFTRRGGFSIQRELILDAPRQVMRLLSDVLIWKAECENFYQTINYSAFCDKFSSIIFGEPQRNYRINVESKTVKKDGIYFGEEKKVGDILITKLSFECNDF